MDERSLESLARLQQILDQLRVECPWDRAQTMESLKSATLEEVCELAEAVDEGNMGHVREELGDLLLHVMFYSKIASERGEFSLGDVADGISEKLVFRHPHVFGDVEVSGTADVIRNWEELKAREGRPRRSRLRKFLRRLRYAWLLVKS